MVYSGDWRYRINCVNQFMVDSILKWYNVYGAIGKAPTYTPKRLISNLG